MLHKKAGEHQMITGQSNRTHICKCSNLASDLKRSTSETTGSRAAHSLEEERCVHWGAHMLDDPAAYTPGLYHTKLRGGCTASTIMHGPFTSLIVSSFLPPYAVATIGFVAKGDFALHCHLVQALLFSVFTFFLRPISFPLPSLISAPFGSSSLLSYTYSTSPISCSINNLWTIFDLLGVY